MTRPCDLDAVDARKLIGNKKLSPLELTKSCIEQIERLNPSINLKSLFAYSLVKSLFNVHEAFVYPAKKIQFGRPLSINPL